jgi:hypothetical protein
VRRYLDTGSIVIAAITLALFVAALFAKGLTKDLFLEIGVFLVSVKIIIMTHGAGKATERLERKLDELVASLSRGDVVEGKSGD